MAESKSDHFSFQINAHSKKFRKFDLFYINRLSTLFGISITRPSPDNAMCRAVAMDDESFSTMSATDFSDLRLGQAVSAATFFRGGDFR